MLAFLKKGKVMIMGFNDELLNIGAEVASLWGGCCRDYEVDYETNRVIFSCIEAGEEFLAELTFDELKDEYNYEIPKEENTVVIAIPESKLALIMNMLAEEKVNPQVKLFDNPVNLDNLSE